ncbi:MAG: YgiQ family radical SAM protein [Desulfobacterales bacterium]
MFLPTTQKEMKRLGWSRLDVIIVSGDSYVDTAFNGACLVGKVLLERGFRVGIIGQPDVSSGADISRLGEPLLFWGVTGGSVDSMVANYTATKKRRKQDDFTPGGVNDRRPDRAVIVYANLIRRFFKDTAPIVLGGIEASLRRVAHYDYWDDRIRRSILFDAKADYLIYGMGERSIVRMADAIQAGSDPRDIPGVCYRAASAPSGYIEMPAFERTASDPEAFGRMFEIFYANAEIPGAKGLFQAHGNRLLIQNPPAEPLDTPELDRLHELDYERELHPYHRTGGEVRALDTIRFSITSHRGCYGGCRFCAIAVHQGKAVHWRSQASIVREAERMTAHPRFRGVIADVGGPTANMYGIECRQRAVSGSCRHRQCLFPEICRKLEPDHRPQLELLRALRTLPGIRSIFVASGIRYDLVLADQRSAAEYLKEVAAHHVSGQLKVAPEHFDPTVLRLMGKPSVEVLERFKVMFDAASQKAHKPQFLTYYLMAAHPGCDEKRMHDMRKELLGRFGVLPKQVQIFTPTPSTWSSLMYHTGRDPFSGEPVFVEKTLKGKTRQKQLITGKPDRRAKGSNPSGLRSRKNKRQHL